MHYFLNNSYILTKIATTFLFNVGNRIRNGCSIFHFHCDIFYYIYTIIISIKETNTIFALRI